MALFFSFSQLERYVHVWLTAAGRLSPSRGSTVKTISHCSLQATGRLVGNSIEERGPPQQLNLMDWTDIWRCVYKLRWRKSHAVQNVGIWTITLSLQDYCRGAQMGPNASALFKWTSITEWDNSSTQKAWSGPGSNKNVFFFLTVRIRFLD